MANEAFRVLKGNASGSQISIGNELLIGRIAKDDGKLGEDPEISREHARVTRVGDAIQIEDLGSTNGTFVNGERISGQRQLKPGDTIEVGTTTLQFVGEGGLAPQVTRAGKVLPQPPDTQVGASAPTAHRAQRPPAPQAPPRTAAQAPPRTAPPAPAPTADKKGPPVPLLAGLGALLLAVVVIAVILAGGGDDSETSASDRAATNRRAMVLINTKGPERDNQGNEVVSAGGGSGIVIDADKGLVLTNAHVIVGQSSIKATIGGEEVNARVLGQAPCEDLAVIELNPNPGKLTEAVLGSAGASAGPGSKVTALGYPGAFEREVSERRLQTTSGTITSSVGPATLGKTLPKLPAVIQHQAPISPGNSGGPLLNSENEVIGINTVASSGQNQNGAISINRAKSLLPSLERGEDVAYVGWDLTALEGDDGSQLLFVQGVDDGSPADRARLIFGDAVTRVAGTPVTTVPEVCDILGSKGPGDSVKVSGNSFALEGAPAYTVTVKLK